MQLMKKQKSKQEYIMIWTGARMLKLNTSTNLDLTDEEISDQIFIVLLDELETVYNNECPINYSANNIKNLIELVKQHKPNNVEIIQTDDKLIIKSKSE